MEEKVYDEYQPIGIVRTATKTYLMLSSFENGRFLGVVYDDKEPYQLYFQRPRYVEPHGTYVIEDWSWKGDPVLCWTGQVEVIEDSEPELSYDELLPILKEMDELIGVYQWMLKS